MMMVSFSSRPSCDKSYMIVSGLYKKDQRATNPYLNVVALVVEATLAE